MTENLFKAPSADLNFEQESPGLGDLELKQLKKLYINSRNLNAFVVFGSVMSVVMVWALFIVSDKSMVSILMIAGVFALALGVVVGAVLRTFWGRILGIMAGVLYVSAAIWRLNLLGVIFGGAIVLAFVSSKRLFGPDRITHKALALAYKRARREKKKEKAAKR